MSVNVISLTRGGGTRSGRTPVAYILAATQEQTQKKDNTGKYRTDFRFLQHGKGCQRPYGAIVIQLNGDG